MTTTIKKGQKVWWDDPVQGKSGEYDVLAVDHTRNIVQIGDGEQTFGRRQATSRQAEGALSHAGKTGAGIDTGYRFPFR